MATIEKDRLFVINAAIRIIDSIQDKRTKIEAEYVREWQKPSIWNLWRGTDSLPPETFKSFGTYPSVYAEKQLAHARRILNLARCSSDTVTLNESDIATLKL